MWNFLKKPLVRISFGLSMLTVCLLLIVDMLGFIPDSKNTELQSRKVIIESLAVQLADVIAAKRTHTIEEILHVVVERNKNILSAAVRLANGSIVADFGNHKDLWTLEADDRSTATQVHVPLFNKQGRWANIELTFTALSEDGSGFFVQRPFLTVVLLVGLIGFVAYLIFLKRTMRELDPDAVIPDRVRTALDTLSEGLLILDRDGYIVFSNKMFAVTLGLRTKDLVGKEIAAFDWEIVRDDTDDEILPWLHVLAGKELTSRVMIKLDTEIGQSFTYNVNASPIAASAGETRGVLITFDDVTQIEKQNGELLRTVDKLENSRREVARQNQELQVLATRDPLTNALNRRSLFQGFNTLFAGARDDGADLSCIMVDIDHFKSVNDRFGHAVGDKVIVLLAKILTELSRPNDLVGRFGGEEFVIVLPETGIDAAASIAERMRCAILEGHGGKFTNALRITSSFGVSTLSQGAATPNELVDYADKALYIAKESGRNRVITWSPDMKEEVPEDQAVLSEDSALPLVEVQPEEAGSHASENRDTYKLTNLSQSSDDTSTAADLKARHPEVTPSGISNEDCLAPLPNSVLLFDRIEQAINRSERDGTQVAVLVIDIDALQRVNDTLGLASGEKFARNSLRHIKTLLRNTDTITLGGEDELLFSILRHSSDSIVVLITDLKQADIMKSILQRIFFIQNQPIEVEEQTFYLNPAVGVSMYPSDGDNADTLLRNASSAAREAKNSNGARNFRFYSDDINKLLKKQFRLESELHQAIKRDELVVYYQPKIDLRTGSILGMEALLRWQHPQLGMVPPNDFIPLAEKAGLIDDISKWVIRKVCRQILFWQEAGYGTISVAVNISPLEFRNPEMGNLVISLIEEVGIAPSAIEIEVTEGILIENIDVAIDILDELSGAGIGISIDDFGTGYASLIYLQRFPLNKIKIDRSFISNLMQGSNDATIVSAIIAMAHTMQLRVVAEGVETEEQLRFLQDLQCDEIQGYLVSRPIPSEEASDLLARASSIRRMVLEHGVDKVAVMGNLATSSASGMIGILNDFPIVAPGQEATVSPIVRNSGVP